MAILLELANGKYAGRSRILEPGEPCRVGTKFGLEFPIPDDPLLGLEHFVAILTEKGVEAYPLGGQAVVRVGDWLIAGESVFRITDTGARMGSAPETPIDQAAFLLRSVPDLFALVDVWNDPEWKARLERGEDPAQPVAEGYVEIERAGGEPWLLSVTGDSSLIGYIARRGWGRSRIVFLRSKHSFESLRNFCKGKLRGPEARFYDPRWLRVALRALPKEEVAAWAGPIEEFHIESRLPSQMERWTAGASAGVSLETIELGMKRETRLPSSGEIEARLDSSRTLPEELMKRAPVDSMRAEQLIRRGLDAGLTSPGSLISYALASLACPGDGLDAALERASDRVRMVDLFLIAANRRREGTSVHTS